MSEEDLSYKKALETTKKYHLDPVGFSDYHPASQTDKIVVKQNNTIIALLIELNIKIDKLLKEKQPAVQPAKNTEIDELITQLKKIEITPEKERLPKIVKRSQKWTFFQLDQDAQSKRPDQTSASQKIV